MKLIEQTPSEVMAAFSHKELAKVFIETSNENRTLVEIITRLEQKLKQKQERTPC